MKLSKHIQEAQEDLIEWIEPLLKGNVAREIAKAVIKKHLTKLAHDLKKKTKIGKVTHGNYHCGMEECCGKETKEGKQIENDSTIYCHGYNAALSDIKAKWDKLEVV